MILICNLVSANTTKAEMSDDWPINFNYSCENQNYSPKDPLNSIHFVYVNKTSMTLFYKENSPKNKILISRKTQYNTARVWKSSEEPDTQMSIALKKNRYHYYDGTLSLKIKDQLEYLSLVCLPN